MRELSVAEQRYRAVSAVISDGLSISQVAGKVGVSRRTLHAWLARYETRGLEWLADRSHRPVSCQHQMPAAVDAALLELRRSRLYWGPPRLRLLGKADGRCSISAPVRSTKLAMASGLTMLTDEAEGIRDVCTKPSDGC